MKYIKTYENNIEAGKIKEQFRDILFNYLTNFIKKSSISKGDYKDIIFLWYFGQIQFYKIRNLIAMDIRIDCPNFSTWWPTLLIIFDILISWLENKKLISMSKPKDDYYQKRYIFKIEEFDQIFYAVKELIKSGKVEKEIEIRLSANKYNL